MAIDVAPDAWRGLPDEAKIAFARKLAASDFGAWLKVYWPDWPWDFRHLRFIRRYLRRLNKGDITRLMIFTPPRHYKSQMVTVRYPAWLLVNDPSLRIIIGAYSQTLAETFSRQVKAIVAEQGVEISTERHAAAEWETLAGGGVKAVGVGTGVTGFGANCFVGETEVMCRGGVKKIRDVAVGDFVLSMDIATGKKSYQRVEATRKSVVRDLIEVKTSRGVEFRCTPEHEIYTADEGYVEADILLAEDFGVVPDKVVFANGGVDTIKATQKVRDADGVEVYDIQVAENHNFFANGILVHNCILIDDPVKSREEAESLAYRRKVKNWWTDDLSTRLEPDGKVVLTMTRWHQDDLAGFILNSEEGKDWDVVKLPAIAGDNDQMGRAPGEPLNPERWSLEDLMYIKATRSPRTWMSLYQQSPIIPGGATFRRSWFADTRYARGRAHDGRVIARYISFDTASKDKDTNAYTAMVIGDLLMDYRMAIRYVWRARMEFPELPDIILRFATQYRGDGILRAVIIEDKSSGTTALQTLRKTAPYWLSSILTPFMPSGDKVQRAEQAATWCRNGSVILPHPSDDIPWLNDFETELFSFPASEFADQVDAFSQLIIYTENLLEQGYRARKPSGGFGV